jgi:hypothetical protein
MHRLVIVIALFAGCSKKKVVESEPPKTVEPASPTTPPAEPPKPAAITVKQLTGFMGFSKDGTRFAWVAPGSAGDIEWLKVITVGKDTPDQSIADTDDAGKKELETKLADFTKDRVAPPADLALSGDLTTKPPGLKLTRGDKSVDVPVGQDPYPATDGAEIWGMSADGKHVAIHIAGKDVPGVVTSGKGRDFHFFFVVPAP